MTTKLQIHSFLDISFFPPYSALPPPPPPSNFEVSRAVLYICHGHFGSMSKANRPVDFSTKEWSHSVSLPCLPQSLELGAGIKPPTNLAHKSCFNTELLLTSPTVAIHVFTLVSTVTYTDSAVFCGPWNFVPVIWMSQSQIERLDAILLISVKTQVDESTVDCEMGASYI